ncbi:MAG: NAD-dependent epimerase/dehydratase family protein, partial [Chloroflexota bacterium]
MAADRRTVLITGGTGFIGAHLARRLAERGGLAVLLDIAPLDAEMTWLLRPVRDRVRVEQASVTDPAALRALCERHGVGDVVHIGGIASSDSLLHRPDLALTVNVGGTVHVLETVRALGLRRCLYFSSVGVLPPRQYEPIDSRHPLILADAGPSTGFYGASKLAGEAFCFAHRQAFGTDVVIVRPSAVYGFGMRVPNFIKPMVEGSVRGEPVSFDHGAELARDYTHVADVAQLALGALDAAPETLTERVFYGATGQPLTTAGQVAEVVRRVLPDARVRIAGGLTEEDRWKSQFRGRLDVEPARRLLGYAPQYAALEDGVAEYAAT